MKYPIRETHQLFLLSKNAVNYQSEIFAFIILSAHNPFMSESPFSTCLFELRHLLKCLPDALPIHPSVKAITNTL